MNFTLSSITSPVMGLPKQFMTVMLEQVAPFYEGKAVWLKDQLGLNRSSRKKTIIVPAAIAFLTL